MDRLEELKRALEIAYQEGREDDVLILAREIDRLETQDVAQDEIPTPMEEPLAPSVAQEQRVRSPGENLIGITDALAALGLGAFTGTAGMVAGTLRGLSEMILNDQYGTEEGARLVEEYAKRYAESATPTPFTEAGREYAQAIGEPLSQLPPVLGTPALVGAPLARQAREGGRFAREAAKSQQERTRRLQFEREMALRAEQEDAGVFPDLPEIDERPMVQATPQDVYLAEERMGIPVMTSDVAPPQSFMGKSAQSASEKIPFVGTGGKRVRQQESRVKAIARLLSQYDAPELSGVINLVAEDLLEARGAKLSKFAGQKRQVLESIKDKGPVPVERTQAKIDEVVADLKAIKNTSLEEPIKQLEAWREAIADQNILNIEANRELVGDAFRMIEMPKVRSRAERALSSIYRPLLQDMTDFIKKNAGEASLNKWQVANRNLREMAVELRNKTLTRALRDGDVSPEVLGDALFSSTKPSGIAAIYRNLSERGKSAARIAVINHAANKAGGVENISPDKFVSQVDKLGKSIDIVFTGPQKRQLDALVRVLDITRRAQQAGVAPPTGVQAVPFVAADALLQTFGGVSGFTAGAVTAGLLARAYESKPIRSLLMRIANTKRGSPEEARVSSEFIRALSAEIGQLSPTTVPETARVQLQELEESEQ